MSESVLCSFYELFNFKQKLNIDGIEIPSIQRDYAQGRKNNSDIGRIRRRFLDALLNGIVGDKPLFLDFVYGAINDNHILTPLDGQQRLTTLYLLHWYAAKKENITDEEYSFLYKFTYKTRPSSNDFCKHLISFTPNLKEETISSQIINQSWFPYDWLNDPTVDSMINMLDEIHKTFNGINNIWSALTEHKRVLFYFLPLDENGLTDEIYIKMNSRGKPLTTFEHFKAEFEQKLHLFNHELAEEIERKIDIKWTDFLWKYKDESCLVDPMFLNYFKFVCDLIELKSGGTLQGRGYDEFELLDLYFDPSNPNIDFEYNVNFIKNSLDALCDFNGNLLTDLFEQYLSLESRDDKAKISYNNIDLLKDCFYNYVDTKTGQRDYQFGKMFLLYSFLLYCQNKTNISNEDFRERIRIINNLILNSEDELNDRATNSRLPGIVEQTESIVINGIILNRDGLNGFNAKQIEEEIEKQKWRKEHQDSIAALNRLENHDLLFGQIYIVGLDNINIFDKFTELFKCNKDLVSCALLTICDYSRVEKGWRYTFGTESNNASWVFLFHKSNALGDDKTTRALVGLLNSMDVINDSTLKSICDAYLSSCEQNNTFDWRYYFIKYPEFRPNKFGRYEVHENDFYTMHAFATKQKASENSYKPFLKIIDCNNNHLDPTKNGSRLVFGDKYIYCTSNGFELREEDGVTVVDRRTVDQIDGIDVENRVDMYLANPFTSI